MDILVFILTLVITAIVGLFIGVILANVFDKFKKQSLRKQKPVKDTVMERQVGELFKLNGQLFEVVEGDCTNCYFKTKYCFSREFRDLGACRGRGDRKLVCFKLIE